MDPRTLLSVVTHADLARLRAATEWAWNAWDAGLLVPAQAAAGVIVGEVLLRHGFDAFADVRKKWEPFRDVPTEQWQRTELRRTALMRALSTAVQREDQGLFPGFNRNVALHRLDGAPYTRANALRSRMDKQSGLRDAARVPMTADRIASAGPDLGGRLTSAGRDASQG